MNKFKIQMIWKGITRHYEGHFQRWMEGDSARDLQIGHVEVHADVTDVDDENRELEEEEVEAVKEQVRRQLRAGKDLM